MKWVLMVFLMGLVSCTTNNKNKQNCTFTNPTDDHFSIEVNNDVGFETFCKKVDVFGIDIYAVNAIEDRKLLHTANLMAQYLDNNEDGLIDNQLVLDAMLVNKAFMVLWKKESDLNIEPPAGRIGQDLGNDETVPEFHTNGHTGRFDAALEEVLHIITHAGFAYAYPTVFGEGAGTLASQAMDVARGGQFLGIPNPYPTGAWYTYDDATCDYNCMTTEYLYWALTSILGAQENRLPEIEQEWKLNTTVKVQQGDTLIYNLLTDGQYKLPTVLPNGRYRQ